MADRIGLIGKGSLTAPLAAADVRGLVAEACGPLAVDGKRVLVIIPDGTRTCPVPLLFASLHEQLGRRVERLDFLIALGTHPPMPPDAVDRLVGVPAAEREERYPNTRILNHAWDRPEALANIGVISAREVRSLTGGLVDREIPVALNKLILEYDQLIICGPVFPHEVAGFSGGAKYLFPGIAGPDIIHTTHWLGALVTSMEIIGVSDTPVRRVIHRAAEFVPRPILCLALVLRGSDLFGMYGGSLLEAFALAADLSARLNILTVPRPFHSVLSMPAKIYDDLWTAAKAAYKTEPVVADGGEIIIYAPHLTEISYTHGALIRRVGYHVRDYFVKQWEQFADVPLAILAHSTHVKGAGRFEGGVEMPRINVTLATGIPEAVCRQVNLGYRDPAEIDPLVWAGREAEGLLLVQRAGEYLYRLG
jgi:nickel-dependent lactate racemase